MGVKENNQQGKAAFIDVETTGLKYRDEIVEMAVTLFKFNPHNGDIKKIIDEYVGLREPEVSIDPEAQKVHGLTLKKLKGKKLDQAHIRKLIQEAQFLIAHNAKFDRRFVVKLFPEAQEKPWLCSMSDISWKEKGFSSRGLQNLIQDHNLEVKRAHRALDDVHSAIKLLASPNQDSNYHTYFHELLQECNF